MVERGAQAFDTSVVVAALLGWHEHPAPALHTLQQAFEASRVIVPGPVLLEAYAVMTRLPSPHRLSPTDALTVLDDTFHASADMPTLSASESWRLVRSLPESSVAGGRTYDAHVLACALKARAQVLWTFNDRDFLALRPATLEVRNPHD